jgi:hypothetical protein
LQNISWRYYIIQTVFIAILLVVIWFTFVETQGLTLEEVAVKFDNEEQFEMAIITESMKTEQSGFEVTREEKVA